MSKNRRRPEQKTAQRLRAIGKLQRLVKAAIRLAWSIKRKRSAEALEDALFTVKVDCGARGA